MKKSWLFLGLTPLTAVLLAQTPTPTGINNGGPNQRAWTGLLVAAGCPAGTASNAPSSRNRTYQKTQNAGSRTPVNGDEMNATAQVVTPPVDSMNTRGSAPVSAASNGNQTYEQAQNRADRTGPVDANSSTPAFQALSGDERTFVRNMDDGCRIRQATSSFELRLPEGRMLTFDNASNSLIQQQLESGNRLEHKKKVFRVQVTGSMQDGTIHVTRIQM